MFYILLLMRREGNFMSKQITVSDECYKQFQAALLITGEMEEMVMHKLIIEYVRQVFRGILGKQSEEIPTNSVVSVEPESQTSPPRAVPAIPDGFQSRTKYTSKSQTNNTPSHKDISETDQKREFVKWFKGLTWNGRPYNPVTISGYTGRIESACNDPAFAEIPVKNLFSITDLAEFKDIQRQIKACAGYSEFDAKSHNGFTAALRKYEEFLRVQSSGDIITPIPTEKRNQRAATIHRWTMEEDEICCRTFLECYVINKGNMETAQFVQMLSREVPDISEGSLRMKAQNIKYLAVQAGLEETSTMKWLSQYSLQCEKAFNKTVDRLGLRKKFNQHEHKTP